MTMEAHPPAAVPAQPSKLPPARIPWSKRKRCFLTVTNSAGVVADTVVNYTITGVAAADLTGGALTGSVTILAGQSTATFSVTPLNDGIVEGNETMTVTLDTDTNAKTSVTVQDTAPVTYALAAVGSTSLVAEGSSIAFTVTPSAAVATEVTLYVQVTGAAVGAITTQATAADFSAVLLPVVIPAGSTTPVTVTANVLSDSTTEGPEGFQVQLLDSAFTAVAGTSALTGTITEGTSSGQTYTLTTGIDTVAGTSGNDTIIGDFWWYCHSELRRPDRGWCRH